MATHRTGPWTKPKPKKSSSTKLSAANLAWAKARAKKAGRRYPNLVDNMAATRRQQGRTKKSSTERDHP